MFREMQLIRPEGSMSVEAQVIAAVNLGWVLYGSPFELAGNVAQAMVRNDPPNLPAPAGHLYKILTKSGLASIPMLIDRYKRQGLVFYGTPFPLNSESAVAMVDPDMPYYTSETVGASEAANALKLQLNALILKDQEQDELINALTSGEGGDPVMDAEQNTRLDTLEAALPTKASLVAGKVPLTELPEFPVGRKVTVTDAAERLTLPVHTDLTIAYQADNGEAYILGAASPPNVEENWQKLGDTQALGITSFNSRTGVVSPQAGDYTTEMVTETAVRTFASTADRQRWDNKADTSTTNAAITAAMNSATGSAKNYADTTFLTKTDTDVLKRAEVGVADGVAPLDANGLVPVENLPPMSGSGSDTPRKWRSVMTNRNVGVWITNTSSNEMIVFLRSITSTLSSRFIRGLVRSESTDQAPLDFRSDEFAGTGSRIVTLQLFVPAGGQYFIGTEGGTTSKAVIGSWFEFS